MKKLLCLLFTILLILGICSCGSSDNQEYDPSKGKVAITDAIAEEIYLEVFMDTRENDIFSDYIMLNYYKNQALDNANSWLEHDMRYKDIQKFTSIEITSEDYIDAWHYAFYGKIYGKDKFNNDIARDFSISFYCRKDSSAPNGYTIERDGITIEY